MSINKKTIIFSALSALIFLLLTGIICGIKCYYDQYPFYDFMLTIFGGIFASMLVVFMCEIQKYLLNKKQTEDELFYHMTIAYSNAMVMKNIMEDVINHPEKRVVENSLNQCREQVLLALFNVCKTDYTTFKKSQKLFCSFQDFCKNIGSVEKLLNNSGYFDIAINTDKIMVLQINPQVSIEINGTYPTVAAIAKILRAQFQTVIEKCEKFMSEIDYSKRYNYEERKLSLQQRSDIFAQDYSLESFLKDNLKSEMSNIDYIVSNQ